MPTKTFSHDLYKTASLWQEEVSANESTQQSYTLSNVSQLQGLLHCITTH